MNAQPRTPSHDASHDHHPGHGMDEHRMAEVFTEHGLRCTRQRRALYETLLATNQHPTADELFATVSRKYDNISLATVYNTLEAFCQAGLAIKLPGKGACSRYDATTHSHLHVRDAATGQVMDAPANLSKTLLANLPQEVLEQIQKQLGFQVDQIQVELVGKFTGPSSPTAKPEQAARR